MEQSSADISPAFRLKTGSSEYKRGGLAEFTPRAGNQSKQKNLLTSSGRFARLRLMQPMIQDATAKPRFCETPLLKRCFA